MTLLRHLVAILVVTHDLVDEMDELSAYFVVKIILNKCLLLILTVFNSIEQSSAPSCFSY